VIGRPVKRPIMPSTVSSSKIFLVCFAVSATCVSGGRFIGQDKNAFDGAYIYAPNGTCNQDSSSSVMATYQVKVLKEGIYVLWGRVQAPDYAGDSFFVQIDDGFNYLWEIKVGKSWHWDAANDRNGSDPVTFALDKGKHTIKVKVREDGAKIDKILLTNDLDFVPSSMGETFENNNYSQSH